MEGGYRGTRPGLAVKFASPKPLLYRLAEGGIPNCLRILIAARPTVPTLDNCKTKPPQRAAVSVRKQQTTMKTVASTQIAAAIGVSGKR